MEKSISLKLTIVATIIGLTFSSAQNIPHPHSQQQGIPMSMGVEKREGGGGGGPPMGMAPGGLYGGGGPMQMAYPGGGGGGYGDMGGGGSYGQPPYSPGYGTASQPYGGPPGAYNGNPGNPGNPSFKDPGFSVQTGFEGFLVPNTWYGLLPWGIEGIVIVCVGLVVFAVVAVAIGALVVWALGLGDLALVKESARGLMNKVSMESISNLSMNVLDALDKYNEISQQSHGSSRSKIESKTKGD